VSDSIAQLEQFMAATRQVESGGNYSAIGPPTRSSGRASGAYQMIDATWDGYGGYARAADAPPSVQDERARELMTAYFERYRRWEAVAVAWHAGPRRADDYVRGTLDLNGLDDGLLTTRAYVDRVLSTWDTIYPVASPGSTVGEAELGMGNVDHSDCPVCSWLDIDFAQFENGQYPDWALTRVPGGDALRVGAPAESWKALVAAAEADGVTITVSDAYRPLVDQERLADELGIYGRGGLAAVPGRSNHGLGLAVDVDDDPGGRPWLQANAARYGWHAPLGDEPWHYEYDENLDPDPSRWATPVGHVGPETEVASSAFLTSTSNELAGAVALIDLDGNGLHDRFEQWISTVVHQHLDLMPHSEARLAQQSPAQTPFDQRDPAQIPFDQRDPAQTPVNQRDPAETLVPGSLGRGPDALPPMGPGWVEQVTAAHGIDLPPMTETDPGSLLGPDDLP
jgi:hypothetical protein